MAYTLVITVVADGKQYEKTLEDSDVLRLVQSIEKNAHHYIEIFSRAVDKVMPQARRSPK